MDVMLCIVATIYAALSIVAAAYQTKFAGMKETGVMMFCGGAALLAAAVMQWRDIPRDWMVATVGGGLICAAAFLNGKRGEQFHAAHHIVRGAITVILVIGFAVM